LNAPLSNETVLWSQQELDFLDYLYIDSTINLRIGRDGWGKSLPAKPYEVPTIEKELKTVDKKFHDVITSPEGIEVKAKSFESLLAQAELLNRLPIHSLAEELRRATRDGSLSYKPRNYKALKDNLCTTIKKDFVHFLEDGLSQMETKLSKVAQNDSEESQKIVKLLEEKISEFRAKLEGLNNVESRQQRT
jgi:hypothetical protein